MWDHVRVWVLFTRLETVVPLMCCFLVQVFSHCSVSLLNNFTPAFFQHAHVVFTRLSVCFLCLVGVVVCCLMALLCVAVRCVVCVAGLITVDNPVWPCDISGSGEITRVYQPCYGWYTRVSTAAAVQMSDRSVCRPPSSDLCSLCHRTMWLGLAMSASDRFAERKRPSVGEAAHTVRVRRHCPGHRRQVSEVSGRCTGHLAAGVPGAGR